MHKQNSENLYRSKFSDLYINFYHHLDLFQNQRKLLLLIVANYSHEFKIRVSQATGSDCKMDDINDDDDDDDDFCVLWNELNYWAALYQYDYDYE